jgi:hypothetical protein
MYPIELIGQMAFRVDKYGTDWSYTDKPMLIVSADDKKVTLREVEYEGMRDHERRNIGNERTSRFVDDKWIPYDPRTFKTIQTVVGKNLHRMQSLQGIRSTKVHDNDTAVHTLAFVIEMAGYHAD